MSAGVKEFVSWLGILGIPTIFAMTGWCIKACNTFFKRLDILASAQKAQMRGQLLDLYYAYEKQGFVYQDQLDEWVNQHKAYHELVGDNGVLEARKVALLKLPTKTR